jgi:hypothetical protein
MRFKPVLHPAAATSRRRFLVAAAAGGVLTACGGGGGGDSTPPPSGLPLLPRPNPVPTVDGPAWVGFGGNAQHTALSQFLAGQAGAQDLVGFYWYTPIDLAPQMVNGDLLTHYGSPLITRHNTVIVPVKTTATGGFGVDARVGATGDLMWSLASDYRLPPHNWIPSFNPVLTQPSSGLASRLFMPASGGRVLVRVNPDAPTGATSPLTFYDSNNTLYPPNAAAFDATVFINTPLTSDSVGNVFFGFVVTGVNPAGLTGGGIARIAAANGAGSFVLAANVAGPGGASFVKTATNSAPALSTDEQTLYVVVNAVGAGRTPGRLLALDATTLALKTQVSLLDPANGATAWVSDDGTSSPLVGPDGDVYIGVLESAAANHNLRGWLLHFNGTLTQSKTPGAFGWDNTPSIVPKAMVPQYGGMSSYLLLTKYNNYLGQLPNGDGRNRVAILDPNDLSRTDPVSGVVTVMGEVITQLGPTPEAGAPAGAAREWCVNTAVADPATSSVFINSEDGTLYRWHLPTDRFTQRITMNSGVAESYTPTVIGPDGRIYAVNNAILHSIGQ